MKRKSNISFGPGAASLILIFVVLTLSVLGMLSLMNARNDRILSQRNAGVLERVYELNASAEKSRAALDEVLFTLRQNTSSDEECLTALSLVLDAAKQDYEGDAYSALTGALNGIANGNNADTTEKEAARSALISLSQDREHFLSVLRILGMMELDGYVVSWNQTDASDEVVVPTPVQTGEDEVTTVDKVYGLRTLACSLQILPSEESGRTRWINYRLMTTLSDEEEEFFDDWDW